MAMICLNMLVMMIQHHGQSEQVVLTMNILLKLLVCDFVAKVIVSSPSKLPFVRVKNNGKTESIRKPKRSLVKVQEKS